MESMFFFEKKNQKTFDHLGAPVATACSGVREFFLLFFKKAGLSQLRTVRIFAAAA
jgi:hypothetical protein